MFKLFVFSPFCGVQTLGGHYRCHNQGLIFASVKRGYRPASKTSWFRFFIKESFVFQAHFWNLQRSVLKIKVRCLNASRAVKSAFFSPFSRKQSAANNSGQDVDSRRTHSEFLMFWAAEKLVAKTFDSQCVSVHLRDLITVDLSVM